MKNFTFYPLLLAAVLLQACSIANIQGEMPPSMQKEWKTVVLKSGEAYQYETQKMTEQAVQVNVSLSQGSNDKLKALWEIKQAESVIYSTQAIDSAANLIMSSKAALMTKPAATPFVNTILMETWVAMNYLNWEVGDKHTVQANMLLEVVDICDVAGVRGFAVQLTSANMRVADACLAPEFALPLSVIRYQRDGMNMKYSATLLRYRSPNHSVNN